MNHNNKSNHAYSSSHQGFILPALIVLSLILMSMGLVALQYVSASSGSVQTSYYQSMAKTAAEAGANMAISCIKNNDTSWTQTNTELTPGTNCAGTLTPPLKDTLITAQNSSAVQVKFSVKPLNENNQGTVVESTGIVEFRYAGSATPSKTYTSSTKISIPTTSIDDVRPIAQGLAVTDARGGGYYSCATANQSLYCWGAQDGGQTGRGYGGNQNTPILTSSGDLAGKRIDKLDLGVRNGCALAEGQAYCWGPNSAGQLGRGYINGDPLPRAVLGALNGVNTQDISIGKSADESYLWGGAQYACAIANVKTYCWGQNQYGQLGQLDVDCFNIPFIGWYCYIYPKANHSTTTANAGTTVPIPVYGYAEPGRNEETASQFYNKPMTDLQAGAYGVCGIVNGRAACWGNRLISLPVLGDKGAVNRGDIWKDGPLSGKFVTSIGTAESSACAVSDAEAYCWGTRKGDGTEGATLDDTAQKVPNGPGNPLYGVNVATANGNDDWGPMCLQGSGNSYCWGPWSNSGLSPGLFNPPTATDAVTSVNPGREHSCMVANGSSYCWGKGGSGQLGDGSAADKSSPVKSATIGLTSGEAATSISAGSTHSCGIANGYIYCWGRNNKGQLGTNNTLDRNQPYGIAGVMNPKSATSVDAGDTHTCAVMEGKGYCWGDNTNGKLGDGTTTQRNLPVAVNGLPSNKKVTNIVAGKNHSCAVIDMSVYCWGDNARGQLGNGSQISSMAPVAVQGLDGLAVTKLTAGDNFTCAVAYQKGYCWGDNTFGQIGRGSAPNVGGVQTTANSVNTASNTAWTDISAGKDFVCAIINGYTNCWGNNTNGQLGRASTAGDQWQAIAVGNPVGNKNTSELSTGDAHACSITAGIAYCWGDNTNGKLGDGTTTQRNLPVAVVATPTYLGTEYPYKISAGGTQTCAVANGKIACWGNGIYGQLGNGSSSLQLTAPSTWTANYIRSQKTLDMSRMVSF